MLWQHYFGKWKHNILTFCYLLFHRDILIYKMTVNGYKINNNNNIIIHIFQAQQAAGPYSIIAKLKNGSKTLTSPAWLRTGVASGSHGALPERRLLQLAQAGRACLLREGDLLAATQRTMDARHAARRLAQRRHRRRRQADEQRELGRQHGHASTDNTSTAARRPDEDHRVHTAQSQWQTWSLNNAYHIRPN